MLDFSLHLWAGASGIIQEGVKLWHNYNAKFVIKGENTYLLDSTIIQGWLHGTYEGYQITLQTKYKCTIYFAINSSKPGWSTSALNDAGWELVQSGNWIVDGHWNLNRVFKKEIAEGDVSTTFPVIEDTGLHWFLTVKQA